MPLEVHLPSLKKWFGARNHLSRASPLVAFRMKVINLKLIKSDTDRIAAIHKAISRLNVEKRKRYIPGLGKTYCNIYAYDLSYFLGSYIPRVWWGEDYVHKILKGEKIDIVYGKTVFELNANALSAWFGNYGSFFSWKRFSDLTEMQNRVNEGSFGIIVAEAKETGKRGHITAVLPEAGIFRAERCDGTVITPLQSQAGIQNRKYFSDSNWWSDSAKFRKFDFWVWDI